MRHSGDVPRGDLCAARAQRSRLGPQASGLRSRVHLELSSWTLHFLGRLFSGKRKLSFLFWCPPLIGSLMLERTCADNPHISSMIRGASATLPNLSLTRSLLIRGLRKGEGSGRLPAESFERKNILRAPRDRALRFGRRRLVCIKMGDPPKGMILNGTRPNGPSMEHDPQEHSCLLNLHSFCAVHS